MNDDGIINLCHAVIVLTCKDYREALRGHNVGGKVAKDVVWECENFFFSPLFELMTKLDPQALVDEIRKEIADENRRKNHARSTPKQKRV